MGIRATLGPTTIKDRFDVYRFFNGISIERAPNVRLPLVKSFLLEHVSGQSGRVSRKVPEIFERLGLATRQIDEAFYSVEGDAKNEFGDTIRTTTGFVESFSERFFAYYTCERSEEAGKRVERWVQQPDLDHAWFSSPLLQAIWDKDVKTRGDSRFTKLVFRHDSMFEMPEDSADAIADEEEEGGAVTSDASEDIVEPERRKSKFEMSDRIGRIRAALEQLQNVYDPLNVLHALQLPSHTGTGAHELRQDGKVTNRTDSFEDHRNTLRYLYRIYDSVLTHTEDLAWQTGSRGSTNKLYQRNGGAPLIVRFGEKLNLQTFERLIDRAFSKRNRFKLWGSPIRMGPTKVQVYGADRHLWQPINLEITESQIVAILPKGTCGNTFHRLVSNIQHYISPKIDAWVGDERFQTVVSGWAIESGAQNGG